MFRSLTRLGNEKVHGRQVTVRAVSAEDGFDACHILYIAASSHRRMAQLIEQVGIAPILTVSEIRGFADAGGDIQLYRAKRRLRFRINLGTATKKRLKISSRLLDLAVVVGKGARP